MWKAGFSEAGSDALMASLSGEMMAGQPELAVAELALFGFIMGAKKISEHHKKKKEAKHSAEEEKQRQEDEYQAQEQARIRAQEEQKQKDAEEAARKQQEEAKQQQQLIHDQNQELIQDDVDEEYFEVDQYEHEREARLAIFQGQADGNAPIGGRFDPMDLTPGGDDPAAPDEWRIPNPNWGNPNPNPPGPDGNPGPNGGGGGGDGGGPNGDDYIILDPAGQPAQNQYQNPFWNMIGQATAQISAQAISQKKKDDEEAKKIADDLPENPTEEEKLARDEAEQAHEDANQITDNQAIVQKQLLDVLTGLGEGELTMEESLAELDKIEADLNKIMASQVKTTQIYSSGIKRF